MQVSVVSDDIRDQGCHLGEGDIVASAYVDGFISVAILKREYARVCEVAHVQEFPTHGPGAP